MEKYLKIKEHRRASEFINYLERETKNQVNYRTQKSKVTFVFQVTI